MFPFNNESEGECRTPAWQKKRQRREQTRNVQKRGKKKKKRTSPEQEGGLRWMDGDDYGAQRGWICYEKPKTPLYCIIAKVCQNVHTI